MVCVPVPSYVPTPLLFECAVALGIEFVVEVLVCINAWSPPMAVMLLLVLFNEG